MSDIAKRLEILKSCYHNELKQSNPSKLYLDDLQGSIDDCERQITYMKDIKIINGAN